jgi:BlaI family transcriptional regulator, penicillinase repressor
VIWKLDKAFLREIVEAMPDPRPHQNTVATLLKILIEKEYVMAEVLGRQHRYSAVVSKQDYSGKRIKQLTKNYFEGSFSNVVSYLVKENNISVSELEQLLKQIKKQQNQQP